MLTRSDDGRRAIRVTTATARVQVLLSPGGRALRAAGATRRLLARVTTDTLSLRPFAGYSSTFESDLAYRTGSTADARTSVPLGVLSAFSGTDVQ